MSDVHIDVPEYNKRHILVVDDSPTDLHFLRTILREQGYVVHSTVEANEAIAFARKSLPDLILLDANMPDMDGYHLCEQLKAEASTRDLPVIFISGGDQVIDKVKAFSKGGVDYILKPYHPAEVLARVRLHLSLRDLQKNLEERVRERTTELTTAIARLNNECIARKQVEDELRKHKENLEELVRERTAELTFAKQQAENASEAKGIFLANMSHELRTPLNSILGYAQMLQRSGMSEEKKHSGLRTIQKSGDHLLTLINDILDLAKIEAGRFELHPSVVGLLEFLRNIGEIMQVRAEEKNLLFVSEASSELPRNVVFDENRLRQVLLNLLANAVKFTDRGQITLAVQSRFSDSASAILRFEVKDTGVGISEENLERVFAPFEQVGQTQRQVGGTGLGLAISRQLVHLMEGEIFVESTVGQGSTFWFEISVAVSQTEVMHFEKAKMSQGYQGPRRTVLIVDDIETNRALLTDLLESVGFNVHEASSGEDALTQIQATSPDLIVMDLVMPGMSGIDAIRRVRQDLHMEIPIIAVSASLNRTEHKNCLAIGANAFLPKPLDQEHLLADIGTLLGLTWEPLSEPQTINENGGPMLTPPSEEIESLYQLALIGDMKGIRTRAAYIESLNSQYRSFAGKLDLLASEFQSLKIVEFIEKYRDIGDR